MSSVAAAQRLREQSIRSFFSVIPGFMLDFVDRGGSPWPPGSAATQTTLPHAGTTHRSSKFR
jgi:hypothetical protein